MTSLSHIVATICACSLAILGAGCGGGDNEPSTERERLRLSAANEDPRSFIERTARIAATARSKAECRDVSAANTRSFVQLRCPAPRRAGSRPADLSVTAVAEYGPNAVVGYRIGRGRESRATAVLFVTPTRDWGIARLSLPIPAATKTKASPAARQGYRGTAARFLAAVRTRDCDAFTRLVYREGPPPRPCDETFATTAALGKRLRPMHELAYSGGNDNFGFFNFETDSGGARGYSLAVARTADGPRVLYVAPSPTAADRRKVEREFREAASGAAERPEPVQQTGRKAD